VACGGAGGSAGAGVRRTPGTGSSISLYQRTVFGEWFRPSWCWRYSSMTAESLMSFFFMLFQVTFLLGCLLGCAAIFTSPFG